MSDLFIGISEMLKADCYSWEYIAEECGCRIDDVEAVYFQLCKKRSHFRVNGRNRKYGH